MTEDETVDATAPGDLGATRVDRIVGIYLVVAAVWIVVSGPVAAWIGARTSATSVSLEIGKGLAFVLVTALVLRTVLRQWAAQIARAADRQRATADRLRRAESARSAFLNGVSHELRTPLSSIVGYGSTIHQHAFGLSPAQVEELAGRLVVNAERLERLVLDLLDTDALLRGVETVYLRPTDIGPLVRRALARVDPGGRTVDVDGPPLVVEVDAAKFERVVQLLLDNVVRHTTADDAVRIQWRNQGTDLVMTVEDDGPGLAPEVSGRVFEPFVQGGHAINSAQPGLGIGLTLVDQYVRLHHGRVTATNPAAGGARITITLPVAQVVEGVREPVT